MTNAELRPRFADDATPESADDRDPDRLAASLKYLEAFTAQAPLRELRAAPSRYRVAARTVTVQTHGLQTHGIQTHGIQPRGFQQHGLRRIA